MVIIIKMMSKIMWAHLTGYLQNGNTEIKGNMLEPLAISEGRIWLNTNNGSRLLVPAGLGGPSSSIKGVGL